MDNRDESTLIRDECHCLFNCQRIEDFSVETESGPVTYRAFYDKDFSFSKVEINTEEEFFDFINASFF